MPSQRDDEVSGSEEFGSRLKQAREAKGVSQEAAAHAVGVASGTLSKYERGTLGMTVPNLAKLSKYYGVSTDKLLGIASDSQERVVREDGKGTPSAEAFIAGQAAIGNALPEEATRYLRSLWHESGDVPAEAIIAMYRHWEATQKGKAVADAPAVETAINVAAGQKPLSPAKKK